ncbi:hypothetical protein PM082_007278 [Marasmius tenuissimus]|nr:hypothetical protein PM082_007278 [Marasmius tenuissimus]
MGPLRWPGSLLYWHAKHGSKTAMTTRLIMRVLQRAQPTTSSHTSPPSRLVFSPRNILRPRRKSIRILLLCSPTGSRSSFDIVTSTSATLAPPDSGSDACTVIAHGKRDESTLVVEVEDVDRDVEEPSVIAENASQSSPASSRPLASVCDGHVSPGGFWMGGLVWRTGGVSHGGEWKGYRGDVVDIVLRIAGGGRLHDVLYVLVSPDIDWTQVSLRSYLTVRGLKARRRNSRVTVGLTACPVTVTSIHSKITFFRTPSATLENTCHCLELPPGSPAIRSLSSTPARRTSFGRGHMHDTGMTEKKDLTNDEVPYIPSKSTGLQPKKYSTAPQKVDSNSTPLLPDWSQKLPRDRYEYVHDGYSSRVETRGMNRDWPW